MSYDKYQYIILCEDLPQYNFVRGWLLASGVKRRIPPPYGGLPHPGSGKEYVRQNFENALKELRRKPREHTVLIAVIDADNLSPERAEEKYLRSKPPDKVFFIVPRWSIETWARWLLEPTHDNALDESKSCKNIYEQKPFTKLGKKLSALMRSTGLDDLPEMPPSLRRAIVHVAHTSKKLPRA